MIRVYTKPDCQQCDATKRKLDQLGLAYEAIDLTMDADAYALVTGLGYKTAPVVVAGDAHWGGFRPDLIGHLARDAQQAAQAGLALSEGGRHRGMRSGRQRYGGAARRGIAAFSGEVSHDRQKSQSGGHDRMAYGAISGRSQHSADAP